MRILGIFSSNEDDANNKKKNDDKSKPLPEPIRKVSTKYPIGEVDPMMLADGMYYKKQNNLGKKRQRPEDEQNKKNENEENKKLKFEKKEDKKSKNINDKINEIKEIKEKNKKNEKNAKNEKNTMNNCLELKEQQSVNFEINKLPKPEKKLKIETNQRIEYSNELSKPKENKINIIHNAINFGIEKIYDNKIESEDKKKRESFEENLLKCQLIHHKEKINQKQEGLDNNLNENQNKIIKSIFTFSSDNGENNEEKRKISESFNLFEENKTKNDNNFTNIENQEEQYSLECLTENLHIKGIRGVNELSIIIKIRNNGKLDWPKNSSIFLKNEKNFAQISAEEIKIISLKSGMVSDERIIYKYLQNLEPKIYYSYIVLNINGKNYGDPIEIKVEIAENEEEKKMNNLINKMRIEYEIPEKEMNNEVIRKALIQSNFDITKAFEYLYAEK